MQTMGRQGGEVAIMGDRPVVQKDAGVSCTSGIGVQQGAQLPGQQRRDGLGRWCESAEE